MECNLTRNTVLTCCIAISVLRTAESSITDALTWKNQQRPPHMIVDQEPATRNNASAKPDDDTYRDILRAFGPTVSPSCLADFSIQRFPRIPCQSSRARFPGKTNLKQKRETRKRCCSSTVHEIHSGNTIRTRDTRGKTMH